MYQKLRTVSITLLTLALGISCSDLGSKPPRRDNPRPENLNTVISSFWERQGVGPEGVQPGNIFHGGGNSLSQEEQKKV